MLKNLQRADWLRLLGIDEASIPRALVLRGTRNLKQNYAAYRERFDAVREIGSPNGLVEDVFIGRWEGANVAYASVYGGAMASEVAHLFGVLGTRLVLQTGCCGIWKPGALAGDLFLPTRAGCGEGAAQYYVGDRRVVHATWDVGQISAMPAATSLMVHRGGIFTTGALFAEGSEEVDRWEADGWEAVDMETAATFAVAEHFGMAAAAILFAFDNPRAEGDIVLNDAQKDERRQMGNAAMIGLTFDALSRFLADAPAD